MAKSYGKIKSKCFKVMIAYISYDIKIGKKSYKFNMSYQPKCKRTKAECFKLQYFTLIHARNINFRPVRPIPNALGPLGEIVLKFDFSDIEY